MRAAIAARDIAAYLDGARLWNVAVAAGRTPAELAAPFDLVGVARSKGLGAPGGSVLAGTRETITRCVRQRRMLGGAMRQVGLFAAAVGQCAQPCAVTCSDVSSPSRRSLIWGCPRERAFSPHVA
jgi:threonine aldolase